MTTHSGERAAALRGLTLLTALLLPLNVFSPTVEAELNNLSETEQSNVDQAISELEKLFDKLRQQRGISRQYLAYADAVMANLKRLNSEGLIKSVPDLMNPAKDKFRFKGNREVPVAAYCVEGTKIRKENGEWEDCPPGTIIVDSSLLDPGKGRLAEQMDDEEIWKLLWELADILFHEKMHEVMVNEQIELLKKKNKGWDSLPESTKEKQEEKALEKALGRDAHAKVYHHQKNVVRIHKKLLEKEKTDLKRKDRKGNKEQIEELEIKIKWLKDRHSSLEKGKLYAMGNHFDNYFHNESCRLPAGDNDAVSIHVLSPGGYWQAGVVLREGVGVGYNLTEYGFLNEVVYEDSMPATPATHLVMDEDIFTGMFVQPDPCNFTAQAISDGEILSLDSTEEYPDHVPSLVNFSFRGEFQHMPFLEVEFSIHDTTGAKIFEVSQAENVGHYDLLLPPGDYTLRSSATAAGFTVPLQAGTQFDSRGYNSVEVVVTYVGFVEWGVIGTSMILLGMLLSRSYKRFMNWRNSVT